MIPWFRRIPNIYPIIKHTYGDALVQVGKNSYSPSQVGGMILQKMKETAEAYLSKFL